MGEETCVDCRSKEEELYWTHFQCTHFSQILDASFGHHLPIPEKFSNHLKKKLPENVMLKGPSGGTWPVELTTDDDTMFFKNGWEEFLKDHFLEEKDLLIFKYNRESCFEVVIFDGHRERDSVVHAKRKTVEDSTEVSIACPQDSLGGTAEKSANDYIYKTLVENTVISEAINKKTQREIKFSKPTQTKQSVRDEESSSTDEATETKPDVEHIAINAPYVSSRRMVTEEDKLNALRLAQAAQSNEGFVVVMKPTHVYRKFYMVIPSGWANRHFRTLEKKDVILRMKENTWNTKFLYCKSKNSGGLSSGWRNFALDNKLQEFDVCLFEPSSAVNNSIVFDVNIFRVL
ncbi:PREDICTED: B3 domain-containing protein REM16-like [Populus euphratica]|uniref:B3 domain-containing protein REM16-like n=1 Tax=Populus euphratica TaxID=75702 RepID=A0AAJ6XG03_POPEU|nr:PREDICTED: B3 domain-containing protein REM16-like [Populus euphratica]